MRNFLKLVALALAGYIIYELLSRYFAEREAAAMTSVAPVRPLGHVPGAAITGGGAGQVQRTLGPDGSTTSERVGRGVVRRRASTGPAGA